MSKYTPPTPELVKLALRFFPEGKAVPTDESLWKDPIQKAIKFYQVADSLRERSVNHRQGAGFVAIERLIDDGELGRSKEVDSVLEKRIAPRFPTESELATVWGELQFTQSDSENEMLDKIKRAISQAGIKEERWVATVLCVLGWCPTREEIKRSGTLLWEGVSTNCLVEKRIVKPLHPPTLEDMSGDIANAVSEYWHTRFQR